MRTIYIALIGLLFTLTNQAQVSYDTIYSKEWDSKNDKWISFDRIISEFDNNTLTAELVQVYENGNWKNYNLKSLFYNNGMVIEEIEKYWDDQKNDWIDNYRKLYIYQRDGKLAQITHQNIFNGTYFDSSREIMKYSSDGKLIEKVEQNYDEAWTNFLKYQYYFNSNDLIMEENLTYWNGEQWGDIRFTLSTTYDAHGNIAAKVKTKRSGKKMLNLTQEKFIFDNDGSLKEQIVSEWNNSKKEWTNKNRAVYVNNMNGYVCSMMNQNKDRKEWVNYLFTEFRATNEPVTGLELAGGMTFSVYPVNFGKEAMIEFNNPYREEYIVKIINEDGQLMASASTNKGEVIVDARNFIQGIYFIELQGSNLFSGKFSIK